MKFSISSNMNLEQGLTIAITYKNRAGSWNYMIWMAIMMFWPVSGRMEMKNDNSF